MNNKTTTSLANIDTSINGTAIIEQFDYEKTISELTEEQKQHYDELTKNINVENPQTIQSYGQDLDNIISRQADEILSKTKSNKNTEIDEITNKLISEFKKVNIGDDESENKFISFARSLPIIGSIIKKVEDNKIQQNSKLENVNEISNKIEALKVIALTDNASLLKIGNDTTTQIYMIRDKIMALLILKKNLEDDINNMEKEESPDLNSLVKKRNSLNIMSKKITDMHSSEYIFKQNIIQTGELLASNNILIQNVDTILGHVIPLFKNALAQNALVEHQVTAEKTTSMLVNTVNDLLVLNSKKLNESSVEIAKQNELPAIKIETLRDTTKYLLDTMKKIKEINNSGENVRIEMINGLKSLNHDISEAMNSL